MNYIKEVNSFYDWLETNSISYSAINLWHALININNKASNNAEWKKEFTVAISTLSVKTSLSKTSIIRARNQLKQFGRIDFKERKGNQSAIYSVVAFHTGTQSATQTDTQSATQCVTQSATINKLNKTKLNKKENIKEKPIRFSPPTIEEVETFCRERVNKIDANLFIDHYQSQGWVLSNGQKMKDWKAAVRTWERRNFENKKGGKNAADRSYNKPSQRGEMCGIKE